MFLFVYLQKASDATSRILLLNTLVHVGKLGDVHFFLKFFHVLLLLTPLACSPHPQLSNKEPGSLFCPHHSRSCTWWWLVSSCHFRAVLAAFPPSPTEGISSYMVSYGNNSSKNTLLLSTQNKVWDCHSCLRVSHYSYICYCFFPVPPTGQLGRTRGYTYISPKRKWISVEQRGWKLFGARKRELACKFWGSASLHGENRAETCGHL